MHSSLDGFVAGPKGEMNWITLNHEIFSYVGKRIALGDTSLYGRVTFEMMENYWPTAADKPNASEHDIEHSRWYAQVHKVVISQSMKGQTLPRTTIVGDQLEAQIQQLRQEEGPEILLFGSPSATHSLIELDLIDGYWLLVNPVILGKGIPLFEGIQEKTNLKLLSAEVLAGGVTALDYEVVRN